MHRAFIVLLMLSVALPAAAEPRRVAVVVGNNVGGPGKGLLRYAERDAERFSDILKTLGGVDETHLLLGKSARELRATLEEATATKQGAEPSSVLFFFYSGHADDDALLMAGSRFNFSEIRQRLHDAPARVAIAFVDACQSGRLTRVKGGKVVPVVDVRFEDSKTYRGRIFVTSSAGGEASQEADEVGASFFTHYLVSALRGAADSSGDRMVSLEEAYQYVYRNTLLRTSETLSGPQHPTYDVDVTGHGELILTRILPEAATLVLDKPSYGTFYVRNAADGTLVAEVSKTRGQVMHLAVVPGTYVVSRAASDHLMEQQVTAAAKAEVVVDETRMRYRALTRQVVKGAPTEMLSVGYSAGQGFVAEAGLLSAFRLGYAHAFGPISVGPVVEYGVSRHTRVDGIAVQLNDAALLGRLSVSIALLEALSLAASGEVGAEWVSERGKVATGEAQTLSTATFVFRGGVGFELDLEPSVVGVWATAGQRMLKLETDQGWAAPFSVGGLVQVGVRF